jgi:hypothetical protein
MKRRQPRELDMIDDIWAITVYFNPMQYQRRRANYRVFRRHLHVPLVAIELAYGPDFDLGDEDADILVQLRGRDVLWQKERLLNVALGALPAGCRKVLVVDCDVVFESEDWLSATRLLLDRFPLVQPFSHLHRMPPDWAPPQARVESTDLLRSPALLLAAGMPLTTCLGTPAEQLKCSTGSAWAAQADLLQRHGFYDACIIGGGDSAFVRAAYGCFDEAMRLQHMNAPRRQHYLNWARPFHDAIRGSVAFVDGNLLHIWHGRPQDRRYRNRVERLEPFEFDPFTDIALDDNGAWRWSSDKPAMHEYVRGYFAARKEDG